MRIGWRERTEASGTGLMLVSAFGPTLGVNVPYAIRLGAFALGCAMLAVPLCLSLLDYGRCLGQRGRIILSASIAVGIGAATGAAIYFWPFWETQGGRIDAPISSVGIGASLPPNTQNDGAPAIIYRPSAREGSVKVGIMPRAGQRLLDDAGVQNKVIFTPGPMSVRDKYPVLDPALRRLSNAELQKETATLAAKLMTLSATRLQVSEREGLRADFIANYQIKCQALRNELIRRVGHAEDYEYSSANSTIDDAILAGISPLSDIAVFLEMLAGRLDDDESKGPPTASHLSPEPPASPEGKQR